jgi:hypothetical protein
MSGRRGKKGQMTWEDLVVYPRPGLVTLAWRGRTEIAFVLVALLFWRTLQPALGSGWVLALAVAVPGLALAVPATRRWIIARSYCVLTRHRLYAAFREIRATTRIGRLPLILRVSPTPTGERAVLWCRAGVCAEDLEARIDHLRAACWARDVRVVRSARWPQVVITEFVRREPRQLPKSTLSRVPAPRVTAEARHTTPPERRPDLVGDGHRMLGDGHGYGVPGGGQALLGHRQALPAGAPSGARLGTVRGPLRRAE